MDKFLTRRNIFIALGVVILAELIWAGWNLAKPASSPLAPVETIAQPKLTQVSLKASQTSLKVGEKVTVSIEISSNKITDGADLVIKYDPKLLTATPVIPGSIYTSYPLNMVDEKAGRIEVSGITDKVGGSLANGVFGSIVFVAKAPGVATISLYFTPGETSDSNVTESGTGKDVLEKVSSLELNILP